MSGGHKVMDENLRGRGGEGGGGGLKRRAMFPRWREAWGRKRGRGPEYMRPSVPELRITEITKSRSG